MRSGPRVRGARVKGLVACNTTGGEVDLCDVSIVIVDAPTLGLRGPRSFYLAGDLPKPPRLAVVGSRAAHQRFRAAVPPLVEAAARCGFSIVSGGAVGIDADAHRVARRLGVPQLAVLPCGPDRVYPPQHIPLFDEIVAQPGSGVLYVHPPQTSPTRAMFASRNAIVVGLATAVVVVEAAARSGTMITATLARRRGRALAAVQGSTGAAILVADHAYGLAWNADPADLRAQAAAWMVAVARNEPAPVREPPSWPASLQWLREALSSAGPKGLSAQALADPRRALRALIEAEAQGLVVELSAGRYIAAQS